MSTATTHRPSTETALWTYRYFSDSEPRDHEGFESGLAFASYDEAVEHARAVLGHNYWGQSGGNEYPFTNRHGRTGYVYVTAVTR